MPDENDKGEGLSEDEIDKLFDNAEDADGAEDTEDGDADAPTPDEEGAGAADESPAAEDNAGEQPAAESDAGEAPGAGPGDGGGGGDGEEPTAMSAGDEDGAEDEGDAASADGPGPAPAESEYAELISAGLTELEQFARQAADVLVVGLDTVVGQKVELKDVAASASDYAAVEAEFASVDHIAFEIKVALTETESHLATVLIPMEGVGALLSIDASAEQMADEEHAAAQVETASNSTRELLDLVSLTLFADALVDAEATLSEIRVGQIDYSMGIIADVAQGATPLRLDFTLVLPGGGDVRVTLVAPSSLLNRMGEILAPAPQEQQEEAEEPAAEAAAEEPAPVAAGVPAGDGPSDENPLAGQPAAFSGTPNVSPIRPGETFGGGVGGGGAGGDPPVHPVRFPPLPPELPPGGDSHAIDLLLDVTMSVTVELGRSSLSVEEVLALGPGSVVELSKLAGEPVDVLVNGRLIARGEVVVVDENFGVRVTEIASPKKRATAMGG